MKDLDQGTGRQANYERTGVMEELAVKIPKLALMEVDGCQVDGHLGDGMCMGGDRYKQNRKREHEWCGNHHMME